MKNLLLSLSLSLSFPLFAQAPLEESMRNYYLNYLPEKVFVQTDKNIYAGGETVWMAVYLTDGYTHRPGTLSKVVRVELHNNEGIVVAQQKLYSEDGYMASALSLPATLNPGSYQLTAYTNYQRNSGNEILFRKTISILSGLQERGGISAGSFEGNNLPSSELAPKPKLRFFPEGGDCVNSIPCRVAYVAEGRSGQAMEISGYLTDETGAEITALQTNEYGMGSFIFLPEAGRHFQGVIRGEEEGIFDVPPALEEGFHLTVQKRKNEIRLLLESNRPQGLVGARIGVHLRGFILVDQILDSENNKAVLDLPLNSLNPGVHVATVFDQKGHPVAERLFFIASKEGANDLQITTDRATYTIRQSVKLKVQMPIEDLEIDSLASGKISLTVLPSEASGGPVGDDICTWLLLNSDIDRPIPYSPELLFATDTQTRDRRVDEFLLTRGWRRFQWEQAFESEAFTPEHHLERGLYLEGRMGKYESPKKPQPGTVLLTQLEKGFFEETQTDELGNFVFGPFVFYDAMEVMLQGRFSKAKQRDSGKGQKGNPYTHLEILDYKNPEILPIPPFQNNSLSIQAASDYGSLSQKSLVISRNFDSLSITLDVVDVKASRISPADQERKERSILYGGHPDTRIVVDSLPGNIPFTVFDILRQMPGVRITGSLGNESIEIRGKTSILLSSEPAYYIDGVEVDLEYLRLLQVIDIEFVDVIRGGRAAILGGGGANGAVLFYTRSGSTNTVKKGPSPGQLNSKFYGFHKVRQFAVFDPNGLGNQNRPDLRTTLHWNANQPTNAAGSVVETFTTSDQKGKFIIVAQGLRKDGQPYFGTAEFEVE